jgi:hypothetical protein
MSVVPQFYSCTHGVCCCCAHLADTVALLTLTSSVQQEADVDRARGNSSTSGSQKKGKGNSSRKAAKPTISQVRHLSHPVATLLFMSTLADAQQKQCLSASSQEHYHSYFAAVAQCDMQLLTLITCM